MKKTLLYSAIAIASLTGCSSSFLEIDPAGAVSQGTLANYDGVEMIATGAYALLYNGGPTSTLANHIYGDCMGGDANKGSDPSDQADWGNLDAWMFVDNNSYLLSKWNRSYEGVHRANELLYIAEQAGSSLDGKTMDGVAYATEIQAEARFLRGLFHFELIRLYGAAVPYISLDDYKSATDPQVPNVDENGNYVYIWSKVADDLKFAADNLPVDRTASGQFGRVTKYAAKAFLAKLYLYWSSPYNGKNATDASKLADATALFKEVIENGVNAKGVKYALAEKYESLWDTANYDTDWGSNENIFDIQQMVSGTQTDTNAIIAAYYPGFAGAIKGSGWGFYCPSSDLAHSYMVDAATGLPDADYRAKTKELSQKMSYKDDKVVKTKLGDFLVDPRIDVAMGRFGVPYYQWGTPSAYAKWIRNYDNCGPFLSKKTIETSSSDGVSTASGTSFKNFHMMRLADVYLYYAECCIRNNDLETARTYINKVRSRALNGYIKADADGTGYTFTNVDTGEVIATDAAGTYALGTYKNAFASVDAAWTALKAERRAELAMEGTRWYDLARWGNIKADLEAYSAYEKVAFPANPLKFASTYEANWVTLPIPRTQINIMGGKLVQNENWK